MIRNKSFYASQSLTKTFFHLDHLFYITFFFHILYIFYKKNTNAICASKRMRRKIPPRGTLASYVSFTKPPPCRYDGKRCIITRMMNVFILSIKLLIDF